MIHTRLTVPTGLLIRTICDYIKLIYFTCDPDVSFTTSFRSVRNFVIDVRQMPASASATGLHWQVAQATSLINVVVNMSKKLGNNHQGCGLRNLIMRLIWLTCLLGIFMENGSGGFMGGRLSAFFSVRIFISRRYSDIVFNGGKFGIWVGNQQCVDSSLMTACYLNTHLHW